MRDSSLGTVGGLGRILILALGCSLVAAVRAADPASPPPSPLNGLVRRLAEKHAAEVASPAMSKEQLLRPEFKFKPTRDWLLLPELAQQLSTNETERTAVYNLLDQGSHATNKLLASEGADNEVAAATAFFVSQLWAVVRQQEPAPEAVDALHAQVVQVLAGPAMARLTDAEKQRFWEYCIGFPVFVLGMKEVATEPSAQADLRTVAATGFAALIGVRPELVDLGSEGLVISAAAEAALKAEKAGHADKNRTSAADRGSSGPGVSSITFAAPAGWQHEDLGWAEVFRATLLNVTSQGIPDPQSEARNAASIFVLPVRAMNGSVQAIFDAIWREQLGSAFEVGDTVVHYRARVKSGLVIYYMGRFFHRKGDSERALANYGALYLVDLGGGQIQPITAIVVPNDPGLGMDNFKESAAYVALAWPLTAFLNSVQPTSGPAPYPAGGYFSPAEIQGNWEQSSSGIGASYVNSYTGASAGTAMRGAAGSFRLGTDYTYDYDFAYYAYNPQSGNERGSTKHAGRYRLNGDIVLVAPSQPLSHAFTCCATGIGIRQTPAGPKRVLVTVAANNDGVFQAPPLVPNWDKYDGIMAWYQEK